MAEIVLQSKITVGHNGYVLVVNVGTKHARTYVAKTQEDVADLLLNHLPTHKEDRDDAEV